MAPDFDFNTSMEILDNAKSLGLYKQLVVQLQKDFSLANIEFKITDSIAIDTLVKGLQEKLYRLLLDNFDDYLSFLYIVDIEEKEFKTIDSSDIVQISKHVGFLVLQREFQKVWYKNRFT